MTTDLELVYIGACDLFIAWYFWTTKNGILRKLLIMHFLLLAVYIAFQLAGYVNFWTGLPRMVSITGLVLYIINVNFINKKV